MKLAQVSHCSSWGKFGSCSDLQEQINAEVHHSIENRCLAGTLEFLETHCTEETLCKSLLSNFRLEGIRLNCFVSRYCILYQNNMFVSWHLIPNLDVPNTIPDSFASCRIQVENIYTHWKILHSIEGFSINL